MRCRHVERLLSDHLEGLLPPPAATGVAAHLAACPTCRRRRDALQTAGADLRALAGLPPPPHLARRAIERWATTPAMEPPMHADARRCTRTPGSSGWHRPLRFAAAAFAGVALIVALLIGLLVSGKRSDAPALTHPSVAKQPPIEEVAPSAASTPASGASRKISKERHHRQSHQPAPHPRGGQPGPRVASGHSAVGPPIGVHRPAPWRRSAPVPHAFGAPASAVSNVGPRGDLAFLNLDPATALRRWTRISPDEIAALEARLRHSLRQGDDFVTTPLPRLAAAGPVGERAAARAAAAYQREVAVVDPRLFHKVTLAFKATEISAVCDRVRDETGIALTAGRSVGDEKVTLFCRDMPLRDVMRQLARPFGYTWLRSPTPNAQRPTPNAQRPSTDYRYELVQDLRSQLLEEELRERDRHAALLALDREMNRYRKYLDLSPEEARARATTAPPEEKKLLLMLAEAAWGPTQMYFRLAPRDLEALRAGQMVGFVAGGAPGQQALPPAVARGVFQSMGDMRILPGSDRFQLGDAEKLPNGTPPASFPDTRAVVTLRVSAGERGQYLLTGGVGFTVRSPDLMLSLWQEAQSFWPPGRFFARTDVLAGSMIGSVPVGVGAAASNPESAVANARIPRDPALLAELAARRHLTLRVQPSCYLTAPPDPETRAPGAKEPRVTTADVLEALHQATGMPIVADYYTRLYVPAAVAVPRAALPDALNRIGDALRLRWSKEGEWLQFRSVSFYDDRLKEVPNRLLRRWAVSRRQRGALSVEDLVEIAQLSDDQLNAKEMAEGARACFGLGEWELARGRNLRRHFRYLAGFTPSQREQVQSAEGLAFPRMSLAQQQAFLALGVGAHAERLQPEPADLAGATLQVDYTVPGWFHWAGQAPPGSTLLRHAPRLSRVRGRTREAALQAARQIDPQIAETQIVPTDLDARVIYTLGSDKRVNRRVFRANANGTPDIWSVP
jgi:anti-sigma factor RsiW